MTKYILNSGGSSRQPEKAALFNQEIVKGLGETPRILLCCFAEKRENWEEKFASYAKNFLESLAGKVRPSFELAFPEKFVEQLKNADAVMIYGGDDYLLKFWLSQYKLPEIWEGKVVAASSAGSNVLVKHFWTCDWRMCLDGLGILPLKFIPHYRSGYGLTDPRGPIDWDQAKKELTEYGDKSLPIAALEEGDFIVLEQ